MKVSLPSTSTLQKAMVRAARPWMPSTTAKITFHTNSCSTRTMRMETKRQHPFPLPIAPMSFPSTSLMSTRCKRSRISSAIGLLISSVPTRQVGICSILLGSLGATRTLTHTLVSRSRQRSPLTQVMNPMRSTLGLACYSFKSTRTTIRQSTATMATESSMEAKITTLTSWTTMISH